LEIAVGSNVGFWQVRQTDAHIAEVIAPGITLLALADGFGAADKGLPTAEVALATLRDYLRRRRSFTLGSRQAPSHVQNLLLSALDLVNARLYAQSGSNDDFVGSGTSLTAVLIVNNHAFVGHAGDSRAYLMRLGGLELLTADDAVFTDATVTSAKTSVHAKPRPRGLLWRSLGTQPKLEASISHLELMPGDRLLLCTDGVHRSLESDEVGDALEASNDPADSVTALLTLARDRGNADNGTLIVARELLVAPPPSPRRRTRSDAFGSAATVLLMVACILAVAFYAYRFVHVAH